MGPKLHERNLAPGLVRVCGGKVLERGLLLGNAPFNEAALLISELSRKQPPITPNIIPVRRQGPLLRAVQRLDA
jgi:hypothetical protein